MPSEFNPKVAARLKRLGDPRSIGWYIFVVFMLALTWSGVKAVQTNYGLQRQISQLKQENAVLQLQNANTTLNNQYLSSSQYEELAARQNLGLAAPGETVLVVPTDVAMKYVDKSITAGSIQASNVQAVKNQPKYIKNLEDWRDFLLGRNILSN